MSTRLPKDDLFEVMANRRRRYAVHALKGNGGEMKLGELADKVAAWENDVEVGGTSYDERKRVYTALQQSHLPKMDKKGVVEFDKNRGVIEPTPALEDVDVYMEIVHGREIPWNQYYLGLTAVLGTLVTVVALDLWPFTLLPETAWMIFVVVAFGASALAHWYYQTSLGAGDDEPPTEAQT